MRDYARAEVITFRFTNGPWGCLSNFAPTPIPIGDLVAQSAEAVYQAAKLADPHAQAEVIGASSAREAKRLAYTHARALDARLLDRRTDLMRITLRHKWAANPPFADALEETGERTIVEESTRDGYWGARPSGERLVGHNVLGRLLMELRMQARDGAIVWPDCAVVVCGIALCPPSPTLRSG